MIETYAERLQKRKEEKMSNYDMDEIERQRDKNKPSWPRSVKLGKDETPYTAVDIEISDDDFRRVALQAHERDITFNKMVGLILKDGLRSSEHIFEKSSSLYLFLLYIFYYRY